MEKTSNTPGQQEEIRELASHIAKKRLAPVAAENDRSGTFPADSIRVLGEAGLPGLIISEAYGGVGHGRSAFAAVVQELAGSCASTALIYTSHAVVIKAIEIGGSDILKKKWLPEMLRCRALGAFAVHERDSGSNSAAIVTKAVRDGSSFIVNGSKFFITSAGEADVYLVLVRTDPAKGAQGLSTLLIEKDTPGLSLGRSEDKMGLRSTSSREMFFSDCRVPAENIIGKEGEGQKVVGKSVVGWGFYGAAAISVGVAKAALEIAVKHAKERTIAGQPIGVHQAVQFLISEIMLATESAEAYLEACAAKADASPESAVLLGFKAKLFASEMAVKVTDKAIQVLGGHGYCRDYIVERLFRDARGLTLHFKTSEWLLQDIARTALGL